MKNATKVPILTFRSLHCSVPYSLEGMLRREIEAAGGVLLHVHHADEVEFAFSASETSAEALIAHLNEAGQGRIAWADVKE